jgi:hypothetical protein
MTESIETSEDMALPFHGLSAAQEAAQARPVDINQELLRALKRLSDQCGRMRKAFDWKETDAERNAVEVIAKANGSAS